MSWLSKILGAGEKPTEPAAAAVASFGTGRFYLEVVGESNYQRELQRARKSARDRGGRFIIPVHVRCEPTNPYDANAVQITTTEGACLGYLPRAKAAHFSKAIGRMGGKVACEGSLAGDEIIGIWIDLCDHYKIK